MSIEEVAKRVKALYAKPIRGWSVAVESEEAELAILAPQLAEWVEKALPLMRAMVEEYGVEFYGNDWRDDPRGQVARDVADADPIDRAWNALRAFLDSPSSLAAEGTTE